MMLTIIKPHHLERTAYVYLRQSSPGQVRKNREGRERQQAMVDRVADWGWPSSKIVLLDGDSGQSGSSQHGRNDFQTLLEAIVSGKAGLVAARELSRLVRDNQDWNHVVRLCRFKSVLLADERRLYDAADAQDRMVLGIQGAFNEFELSMILDRMQQSLRQKAERGEQWDALPPGYVCRRAPLCEKHPDESVQRAVQKVLNDFQCFSSVRRLYLHLREEAFQLPVVPHGSDWRDVQWITPSYHQILDLVRNPTYAGIYVRGRCKAFVTLNAEGHKQTKYRHVPREQWDVFLENHHPAYITRQEWERNVEKIAANANVRGALIQGAAGRGESLMAGLLRCRRCGHRFHTRYSSRGVHYLCCGGAQQRLRGGASCLSFSGAGLEALLAEEILDVVGPAGLQAAERAAERLTKQHHERRQLLVDRLQAARDAEQRAAREYKQTDATYTAVRQALGAEWETALAQVAEAESRLSAFDRHQPALPMPSQREQLAHLSEDVRRLWNHPRVTGTMKKQLARVLIQEIVVDIDEERDDVVLFIQWSGGHHTVLRGSRRRRRGGKLPPDELKSLLDTLRKVLRDDSIAAVLNREGIRAADGSTWTRRRVERFRQRTGVAAFNDDLKASSGWLTQAEAATRLAISPMSVHRLVNQRILTAEQPHPGLPMIICARELERDEVQSAVSRLKTGHYRPLPDDPRQLAMF
jgi:DNA invertase Pin-like site-specific DNA recombinase